MQHNQLVALVAAVIFSQHTAPPKDAVVQAHLLLARSMANVILDNQKLRQLPGGPLLGKKWVN
jgi:hypothetical protein